MGHEVTILSRTTGNPNGMENGNNSTSLRIPRLRASRLGDGLWARIVAEFEAEKHVRKFNSRYDVVFSRVQAHSFAAAIARKRGLPVVAECLALTTVDQDYELLHPLLRFVPFLSKITKARLRRLFGLVDIVFVSGQRDAKILVGWGVSRDKLKFGYNAVDLEKFNGRRLSRKVKYQDVPMLVYISTFMPWHGQILILRSFEKAVQRGWEGSLILLGDGPERRLAEEFVRNHRDIASRVVFTGSIPHEDAIDYLVQADIGLLIWNPIYFHDRGSSVKLVDYMAAGLPVIADKTDRDALRILGKLAIVTGHHDLANRIVAVTQDRKMLRKISHDLLNLAQKFSWKELAMTHCNIFADLIKDVERRELE